MTSPALSDKTSLDLTAAGQPSLPDKSFSPTNSMSPTAVDAAAPPPAEKKSLRFWLIFLALCCATFLSALDLTAVSTALPQIAADFESPDYSWVGSAYALTSTALIPWTGGLAAIFGRRPVMLAALVLFALGSALTGAAQSMAMVIGGRSVQGIGGGAILTMTEIVVTDLVPLAERGAYFGIIGAIWALASAIGPPIGGALASANAWRWLFYLNLPLTGLAMVLVLLFLNVKSPQTTMQEKLDQMDYANVLFVASSTATILGLTWGGVTYPWSSFRVLVPLILGIVGMVAFLWIERTFVKHPTVPFDILSHRTSLLGYLTTFLHSVIVMAVVYFLPTYFQADKGDSPIQSGVHLFPISFIVAPFAIFTGISVTVTGHYRTQNWIAWAFVTVGCGLLSILKWNSSTAMWASFSVIVGIGLGILYASTNFPVLAPLQPAQQPHAMAFYGFVRSFGQVFGIAIGSTVLQNQLAKKLPEAFAAQFGEGEIAFAAIPYIKALDEPLRNLVRAAFADSLQVIWQVCIGIAGIGFLLSLPIQQMDLATETDQENWGLKEKSKAQDQAQAAA
ncbi:hypothetical protein JCM6882_007636 [Rhodosporidiobolus microsporus]